MSEQKNKIKDELVFLGGMNTDDDPRFLPKGDYIDAVNVTVAEDGSGGIIVNMKGNEAVFTYVGSYGIYLCGWAYYAKNESVILFFYAKNSLTPYEEEGWIIEYNPQTDEDTTIIKDECLFFENPIGNDFFVDADISGDWLAWTDSVNPPRMINIQDVKDNGPAINDVFLDLHKARPTASSSGKHIPPLVSLATDASKVYNNLTTGYQFKYRYVYDDFRPSTWSPASDLAISYVLTRGEVGVTLASSENYIKVQFNSSNINVKYIDIAVREGNIGSWFRIIKIDKADPENVYSTSDVLQTSALSDSTEYVYRFYNNEGRIAISDLEANKAYDTVPDKSETLAFIGENRLALGGNTEGKDIDDIELNVTLTPQYTSVSLFGDFVIAETIYVEAGAIDSLTVRFDLDTWTGASGRDVWLPGNYVYFDFEVDVTLSAGSETISSTQYVIITEKLESLDELGNFIADNGVPADYTGGLSPTGSIISYNSTTDELAFIVYTTDDVTSIQSSPYTKDDDMTFNTAYDHNTTYGYINDLGFKRATRPKLALIYEDKYGKKYPALTSTDTEVEIESIASGGGGLAHIQYSINNIAPSDAVAYRWAFAYKPRSFVQTLITDELKIEDENGDISTNLIALDISGKNQFIPPNYIPQKGDVMRIIREGGSTWGTTGDYTDTAPEFIIQDYTDIVTNELTSTETTGKWLIINPSNLRGYDYDSIGDPSLFHNAIVEIYRDITEDTDYIFYEIGSGGYCVGGTTNHDDWHTGNATGYINQGDAWYRPLIRYQRMGSATTNIALIVEYLEDPYPYTNAPRKDVGIADPNVEYPESRSKYDNTIRWSNKYFEDTRVNGFSTFDSDNKTDVSNSYGKIKGLEQLGKSLVVICEGKVFSGGIGYTEYLDAKGSVHQIKSDSVIGLLRPHIEDYGTFLKESILNTGKYIYFFDLYNKAVVRKASNGLFPISGKSITPAGIVDYKMRTYFKQLSDGLISSLNDSGSPDYADVRVFMGYDKYYCNVYITFSDRINNGNNVSLIFNEDLNRWISRYSSFNVSTPSIRGGMYPFTKTKLMGFNEAESSLYLFNSDITNRTTFFGHKFYSSIKFIVAGKLSNVIKIFDAIGIHSDDVWDISADGSVYAPVNDSYREISSKIPNGRWRLEEGVYRSEFMRNSKSTSDSVKLIDIYTGDLLRSYYLIIEMTNNNNNIVKLFKVDTLSELSV